MPLVVLGNISDILVFKIIKGFSDLIISSKSIVESSPINEETDSKKEFLKV